ncbi:hypothetical protein CVT26_015421 [Gymnopilus dilepis]|uniref:Uncharacterized protein n=1 Tax=Gymnopilus dilepis TaxID=231916 RepID=A0A409YEC5_9AGAR|nr:hypothetical protein CVT26_015421 [Gymnopilus dilepis]
MIFAQDILSSFSAQRDCLTSDCTATALNYRNGKHYNDNRFLTNIYGLHNATLRRKFIPRHLTRPVPLYDDRTAFLYEVTAKLRVQLTEKRTRTKQKRAAPAATKKAKKAAAGVGAQSSTVAIEPGSEEDEMDIGLRDEMEDNEEDNPRRDKGSKRKQKRVA